MRLLVSCLVSGVLCLGCAHGDAFAPPGNPDVGPSTAALPRRLTFHLRDDFTPRVTGNTLVFARSGDAAVSIYTGLARESCLAFMPAEGGSIFRTLCPSDYMPVGDTIVHTWFEPSLSPDGRRIAFIWQRSLDVSALGYIDANLMVVSIDQPADTTQVRRAVQYVEDGALPRRADIATEITWVDDNRIRFMATFEQINKVKGGGAERVTDTTMVGLSLMELDANTGQSVLIPGSDSVLAYANAPDGSIWLVREPDSTLLLRLDPATGVRTELGRFSINVVDLIVVNGAPVAAVADTLHLPEGSSARFGIQRLDLNTGVSVHWDVLGRSVVRLAAAGGTRFIAEVQQEQRLFGAPADLWLVEFP